MTVEGRRPYLSSFTDRHGQLRWRFRRGGRTVSIKGQPGEPQFEEIYSALLEGREPRTIGGAAKPGGTVPKSFKDAWERAQRTPEWLRHDDATKAKNSRLAGEFLLLPIADGFPEKWGDQLVSDLKRRHLKDIIARFVETPHKAKHLLVTIRKMIAVALDQEWIETDPAYGLKFRPDYGGWRAWTSAERDQFEAFYQIGTNARTCYSIALWLGNRRSDVATLKWSQIDFARGTVTLEQEKGGKHLVLPLTPMLRDAIEALPRTGEFVLTTAYGKPYSAKSLTGQMAHWTTKAGLPKGCTLHGLRKSLGKLLAEGGASTRQLMDTLGHDDIAHAELYSREASQELLAREAMEKVTRLVEGRKRKVE